MPVYLVSVVLVLTLATCIAYFGQPVFSIC
jgi:hypothetical protein